MAGASLTPQAGAGNPLAGGAAARGTWRVLSPVERLSEILFGLIMALSIVGSLSVATAGEADVRQMLVAALGCNTAWGIVDALMYVLSALAERYRGRALLVELRREPDVARAQRLVADQLPPVVAACLGPPELERVRRELAAMPELPRAGITRRDLAGAAGVFLLVFASTLPVVVPFVLPLAPREALRLSHGIAIALLFVVGHRLGTYISGRPLAMGASMVGVGALLVGLVMALGG